MAQKWYPVIDYVACVECGTCVNFCPHHVYNKTKAPTPVSETPLAVAASRTYIYDTKGFYQPVYEFSGYINNRENLWCVCQTKM